MKMNAIKNLLGILGLILAIGVSLFAILSGGELGLTQLRDAGISSMIYSGIALVGYLIINSWPKLGGVLMILGGLIIIGQLTSLGVIAGIPLIISGIIGMANKKKKSTKEISA